MPKPAMARPAIRGTRLVAVADRRAPASKGTALAANAFFLPRLFASVLPLRLPMAAPASRLLTTCHMQLDPIRAELQLHSLCGKAES